MNAETIDALNEIRDDQQGKPTGVRVTKIPIDEVEIKSIREQLNLSQEEFAEKYGLPVATIRNWEQGRRKPDGATRLLLQLIRSQPDIVAQEIQKLKLNATAV
jgi:putative transcriptional regulator